MKLNWHELNLESFEGVLYKLSTTALTQKDMSEMS